MNLFVEVLLFYICNASRSLNKDGKCRWNSSYFLAIDSKPKLPLLYVTSRVVNIQLWGGVSEDVMPGKESFFFYFVLLLLALPCPTFD